MKRVLMILLVLLTLKSFAQTENQESTENLPILGSSTFGGDQTGLSIGAYAQIDYNQPLSGDFRENGKLDVHRMVLMMGYRFNAKTKFFTEIEYEHVKEVFIEQAYFSHRINKFFTLKGGLLLVPMGIINEYHEPPSFNGVERPNVDKLVVPTTWREIGAGFTGRVDDVSLKYQLYVLNGFNGYDGKGKFSGKNGLRKGRQKGAESFMSSPNFSAKVEYYGIPGLKLGLATYLGKSQSTLYDGLNKSDEAAMAQADSSSVSIRMFGVDARYNKGGFQMRGQYNRISIKDSKEYNAFTGNDLGSSIQGYYVEVGYDLLHSLDEDTELITFVRYENYDTHNKVEDSIEKNDTYDVREITFGMGWKITSGAVLKGDFQVIKSKADDESRKQLNLGIGIWF